MSNERITENIVREHFKNDPLFSSVKFEEQKSTNVRITDCLAKASKNTKGVGSGRPEFIITFPMQSMDYLIIVECKADERKHESKDHKKPKDFAVDGVLHYSKFLSEEFNVISIAVSGQTKSTLVVSNFIQMRKDHDAVEYNDKKLLTIFDYVKAFRNEQLDYNIKDVNIVEKAISLNDLFHKCSISESMRNTLVSGILLSLQDDIFKASYPIAQSSLEIGRLLIDAIRRVLTVARVRRIEDMMGVYNGILNEPLIKEKKIKKSKEEVETVVLFKQIIHYLQKQVYPLMSYEQSGYDILGRFYTEFIRYAASKQKQGLVLTPSHITDLFCDLVDLRVNDIVYDPCCGTGGFLISAMRRMITLAGNDSQKKDNIRKNQLLGVELRPEMFTFACSNMMLRGDGKSNLDCGDCFDSEILNRIKALNPSVSFLNPPYDQGTADQLRFVEQAILAVKDQGGRVAAIVQMSCALKNDNETLKVRKRLIENYSLRAVISMPDDLFYPVGVVTCIMIFDAVRPTLGMKTWFGYLKNDGFVKRKNKGRIDHFSKWKEIKSKFLDAYKNNDEVAGLSVKRVVKFSDEWCAEAYMKTDYSKLSVTEFELVLKKYAIFKKIGMTEIIEEGEESERD